MPRSLAEPEHALATGRLGCRIEAVNNYTVDDQRDRLVGVLSHKLELGSDRPSGRQNRETTDVHLFHPLNITQRYTLSIPCTQSITVPKISGTCKPLTWSTTDR